MANGSLWTDPLPPPEKHLRWMKDNLFYDDGIVRVRSTGHLKYFKYERPVGRLDRGYIRWHFRGRDYLIHHIVWFLCKGEWPSQQLDHEDRFKSNNHIWNLRLATSKLQGQNSPRIRAKLDSGRKPSVTLRMRKKMLKSKINITRGKNPLDK